jgi:hypothetical protein
MAVEAYQLANEEGPHMHAEERYLLSSFTARVPVG